MSDAPSTRQALMGLSLLLKFDLRAWAYFDKTPQGFWKSFLPALVLAPFICAHLTLQYMSSDTKMAVVPFAVVQVLAYVVSCTLFPFVMIYLARLLERTPRYFWHVVPYNWFQFFLGGAVYAVFLLADINILPAAAMSYAYLASIVASAVYCTFIAGIGLQVSTGTAMSLAVLDLVLGLITSLLINRI